MTREIRTSSGTLILETCCKCHAPFAMSITVYNAAMQRREAFTFYCPNGHPQVYRSGESEETKLRREINRLTQQMAYKDDQIEEEKRRASAYKGQTTRLKNRARAGVCPCCNRHFVNLERHMGNKHPDFDVEEVA